MSEKEKHGGVQRNHEAMYQRTVQTTLQNIERGAFTEAAVPRVLEQLRVELGQCIELLLISPEFYSEQMELLQDRVELVMQS